MKFLVDANLSWKVKKTIEKLGFDVLHTDDLPDREFTPDEAIRNIANKQKRIIITKDSDFLQSHLLRQNPEYLLLITTGNINNKELLLLIESNFIAITTLFISYQLIELSSKGIIVYEK